MRWDLIVPVLIMYAAVFVVTSIALKRVRDSLDYMLAGRQLGLGLMIPHIIGAFFGAGSTLGVTALAYIWGMGGTWYNIAEALGLWLLMVFLARRLWHLGKRLDFVTLPDLLESYYGNRFKIITGLFIAAGYMSWVAGQIVGGGRVLEMITGFPLLWAIILSSILVGFYAGFGGLWGSVFADLIFGSMTVVGSVIVVPILIHQLGGWQEIMSKVPETYASFFWLGEKNPQWGIYGWTSVKWFFWYLMVFMPAFAIGQLNIQRIYASKTEKVAHQMSTFIASYVAIQPVFFAAIGIIAFALAPDLAARDQAAPWVMTNVMNTAVGALFLCGVMATVMSCAAGGLNTAVSSIVRDLWRNVNPKVDELKAGRITSLAIMILSLVFALVFPDVVGWLALGFTLMGVSIFIPTVIMVIKKGQPSVWATSGGAFWSSLIAGLACVFWHFMTLTVGKPYSNLHPIFIGFPIALVLILVISRLMPETEDRKGPEQTARIKVVREVFTEIHPTFALEGWGTIIFFLSVLFAIHVLPKLFLLL